MKALPFAAFLAVLLFGCTATPPAPPPSDVPSAPALAAAGGEQLGEASAAVEAARQINQHNAPGVARDQVDAVLSVASANLPEAAGARVNHFLAIAQKAFAGKPDEAVTEWAAERALGSARLARIAELERKVAAERAAAALELQRQLKAARDQAQREADAKERLWLMLLFFGGGAACLVGAAVVGQLGAAVPMFGPRAALGLGIAGAVLLGIGVLIRTVDRLLEQHPFLFWGGLIFAGLAVVAAIALIYANHRHATPRPA